MPTYTQRLIDDLKRHEDEFKKKQLDSFSKNAEIESKLPFKPEYTVTKGALDRDLMPDERVLLRNSQSDLDNWANKSDLKLRRSREFERNSKEFEKQKAKILQNTSTEIK